MRAMLTPQFGPPDLFEERDAERPQPGPGEVLVRVVAAGTNPVDAKYRSSGDAIGLEARSSSARTSRGSSRRSEQASRTSRRETRHGRGKVVLRVAEG